MLMAGPSQVPCENDGLSQCSRSIYVNQLRSPGARWHVLNICTISDSTVFAADFGPFGLAWFLQKMRPNIRRKLVWPVSFWACPACPVSHNTNVQERLRQTRRNLKDGGR
eukprot:s749_g11.t1